MTDDLEPAAPENGEEPNHLPVVIRLAAPSPGLVPGESALTPEPQPVTLDQIAEAVLKELKPHELAYLVRNAFNLARHSESEPSRMQATKLLFDRFMPKQEDLEQKRRETDERNAAIAEAKGLLAEFAASRLAGLHQPATLDQTSAPEPADAADNAS